MDSLVASCQSFWAVAEAVAVVAALWLPSAVAAGSIPLLSPRPSLPLSAHPPPCEYWMPFLGPAPPGWPENHRVFLVLYLG
jgi:hypothetical protein